LLHTYNYITAQRWTLPLPDIRLGYDYIIVKKTYTYPNPNSDLNPTLKLILASFLYV